MKERKSSLTSAENTLYRCTVGRLNWITGISRPGINFSVYESNINISNQIIIISTTKIQKVPYYSLTRFKDSKTSTVYRC